MSSHSVKASMLQAAAQTARLYRHLNNGCTPLHASNPIPRNVSAGCSGDDLSETLTKKTAGDIPAAIYYITQVSHLRNTDFEAPKCKSIFRLSEQSGKGFFGRNVFVLASVALVYEILHSAAYLVTLEQQLRGSINVCAKR